MTDTNTVGALITTYPYDPEQRKVTLWVGLGFLGLSVAFPILYALDADAVGQTVWLSPVLFVGGLLTLAHWVYTGRISLRIHQGGFVHRGRFVPFASIRGLRYNRIILLMDPDSDGHHIATLLLTFFYMYMPELIRRGHVFLAQPPLFRVDVGKESYWAADDAHLQRILAGITRGKPEIQRFKGLGEMMPATLKDTTLDPKKRQLIKIGIKDELYTDRAIHELMGKDAAMRYQFIMERAAEADELDI